MAKISLQDLDLDNELIEDKPNTKSQPKRMRTESSQAAEERRQKLIQRRKTRLSKQHWETTNESIKSTLR